MGVSFAQDGAPNVSQFGGGERRICLWLSWFMLWTSDSPHRTSDSPHLASCNGRQPKYFRLAIDQKACHNFCLDLAHSHLLCKASDDLLRRFWIAIERSLCLCHSPAIARRQPNPAPRSPIRRKTVKRNLIKFRHPSRWCRCHLPRHDSPARSSLSALNLARPNAKVRHAALLAAHACKHQVR